MPEVTNDCVSVVFVCALVFNKMGLGF